jgi:chromosome partitioning protein
MITVVGGIKGGAGKTTIATSIAILRQSAGARVVLVDADEQRSASEFADQRMAMGNGRLDCVKVSGKDAFGVIQELAESYDDIVTDVGGRDTAAQRAALLAADMLLLPFAPGNFDAWTLPQAERLVSEVRQANKRLDAAAFISRGYANGPDNREAAEMLRASTVLRFVDAPLIERRAHVRTSGDGLSVIEVRGPSAAKAAAEVRNLYAALFAAEPATNAA